MTHSASVNSGLSNTLGVVFTAYSAVPTGITWDGVAMTKVTDAWTGNGGVMSVYVIVNPTYSVAGKTISFSWTGTQSYQAMVSMLLTGANQSTTVDATATQTFTGVTSIAGNITTVADNALPLAMVYSNSGTTVNAGTNTTLVVGTGGTFVGMRYTNPKTPAGVATVNANWTGAGNGMIGLISIAPAGAAAANAPSLMLTGVGN